MHSVLSGVRLGTSLLVDRIMTTYLFAILGLAMTGWPQLIQGCMS